MPTVIIPPTDVSPYTGTGNQVLATNPTFPGTITVTGTGNSFIDGTQFFGLSSAITPAATSRSIFYAPAQAVGQTTIELVGTIGGYGAGINFSSALGDAATTYKSMAKIVADGADAWNSTPATQDANLSFWTSLNGTLTKQMTLASTGYLGINETNPAVLLHIKTSATGTGDFDNPVATFRSTAAGRTITLQFSDTTNQSYISSKSGALNFGVGGATLGMSLSAAGALAVQGAGTSTFAGPVAITSSGTSLIQLNLPFTSRIILGEGALNNANPAITMYRTTGGAAQGTAIRLYQPNSTGDFQIQKGTTNAPYGTETYTTHAQFTYNGNFIVGSVADNGNKLQVDGSAFIAGNLTNYNQRILRGPSSNSDATLVPVVVEFGKSSGNVGTTTATVVITGTVAASGAWREGLIEVYAAGGNAYSGDEGGINELVTFQHDSSTGLNPRNFTVIRTNSAGSAITITYAGTSPTTFTITVSKTDGSVPGTVPTHEVFAYVRVINSNAISLS